MSISVPVPASATPARSRRLSRSAPAFAGMYFAAIASAAMPIGRLTAKIDRQPVPSRSASTSEPPTIGPITADRPMIGPNMPHTLPISDGGKRSRIRPKTCGIIIAANAPCSAREPISMSGDWASAPDAEAIVKPPIPVISIGLRPKTSPSRPPISSRTASTIV